MTPSPYGPQPPPPLPILEGDFFIIIFLLLLLIGVGMRGAVAARPTCLSMRAASQFDGPKSNLVLPLGEG